MAFVLAAAGVLEQLFAGVGYHSHSDEYSECLALAAEPRSETGQYCLKGLGAKDSWNVQSLLELTLLQLRCLSRVKLILPEDVDLQLVTQ